MNAGSPSSASRAPATVRRASGAPGGWHDALKAPGALDRALGALGAAGGGALAGFLGGGGRVSPAALAFAAAGWGVAAIAWRAAARWAHAAGRTGPGASALAAAPLLPWLATWPLIGLAAANPLARSQLLAARTGLGLYLLAWLAAGLAALALWLRATAPPAQTGGSSPAPAAAADFPLAQPAGEAGAWWIVAPLLALAAAAYWNGAVLDPLQGRGFPDYVTQMKGARRLLAGALPYDPSIPVWTDVNLPPVTLLLLFVPFTPLPDLAGKLAYFLVNHLAFLAGLGLLLAAARPRTPGQAGWAVAVAAMALTYEPWHDSLRLGQQNGIVFLCLAGAAAALVRRQEALAGVALAAALIGKPSSALLGLYFLFAGRWRAAIASATTGLAAFAITLPWAGVENWRFYVFEKAPQLAAGIPQQSNVALLALHARLFLPTEALSSFEAMPDVPAAQGLTRAAQVLGALALWRLTRPARRRDDRLGVHLEFGIALVLSLSLVGHAWQSYVTWLIVAFVPLADRGAWQALPRDARRWTMGLAAASYAALALNDVYLYKVIGHTTGAAALFASLPNLALLSLAFVLALLLAGHDACRENQAAAPDSVTPVPT